MKSLKIGNRKYKIKANKVMAYRVGEKYFRRLRDANREIKSLRNQGWNPWPALKVMVRQVPGNGPIFPTLKAATPALIQRKIRRYNRRDTVSLVAIAKANPQIMKLAA